MDAASAIFGGVQVISQLRRNQTVRFRSRTLSVQQYFERSPGVPQTLRIRGGRDVHALVGSARLYVGAHAKKRVVIALKYTGEEDYRYLLASDLTLRYRRAHSGHRPSLSLALAGRRVRRRAHSPVGESPTGAKRLKPRSLGGAVAREQDGEALRPRPR